MAEQAMRPLPATPHLDALRQRHGWPTDQREFEKWMDTLDNGSTAIIRDLIQQAALADLQDHVLDRLDRLDAAETRRAWEALPEDERRRRFVADLDTALQTEIDGG